MKTILFIFLMLCPLWACSSCEDEDNKLPGSKPEILLGKWESVSDLYADFLGYLNIGKRWTIYEFTKTGGSITHLDYITKEDRYEESYVRYFTNWSYDGKEIHFIEKRGRTTNRWGKPVSELTQDYFKLGIENSVNIYYKIK